MWQRKNKKQMRAQELLTHHRKARAVYEQLNTEGLQEHWMSVPTRKERKNGYMIAGEITTRQSNDGRNEGKTRLITFFQCFLFLSQFEFNQPNLLLSHLPVPCRFFHTYFSCRKKTQKVDACTCTASLPTMNFYFSFLWAPSKLFVYLAIKNKKQIQRCDTYQEHISPNAAIFANSFYTAIAVVNRESTRSQWHMTDAVCTVIERHSGACAPDLVHTSGINRALITYCSHFWKLLSFPQHNLCTRQN